MVDCWKFRRVWFHLGFITVTRRVVAILQIGDRPLDPPEVRKWESSASDRVKPSEDSALIAERCIRTSRKRSSIRQRHRVRFRADVAKQRHLNSIRAVRFRPPGPRSCRQIRPRSLRLTRAACTADPLIFGP